MEGLGRAAKARRSNHTERTYLKAVQEREQRAKQLEEEMRDYRVERGGVRRHRGAQLHSAMAGESVATSRDKPISHSILLHC